MTSPLVRRWLAERLEDWVDHGYAIWRGLTHALGITTEWDPCEIEGRYLLDVPAPGNPSAGSETGAQPGTAAPTTPSPAFDLMLVCERDRGGCGAGVNAPCVTADGRRTRPHKARRQPRRTTRQR